MQQAQMVVLYNHILLIEYYLLQEIKFQIGNKNLLGRFEPISESWLDRRFPLATGHHEKIKMAKN